MTRFNRALILLPKAQSQNDGPSKILGEGALFQKIGSIVSGSAIVSLVDESGRMEGDNGLLRVAFEGNIYNACNLVRFRQRAICAAGRLTTRYPSISYASLPAESLSIAASMDLNRMVIDEFFDLPGLSRWSGESQEQLNPSKIRSGSFDHNQTSHAPSNFTGTGGRSLRRLRFSPGGPAIEYRP